MEASLVWEVAAVEFEKECRRNGWPTAIDTFQMTLKSRPMACFISSKIKYTTYLVFAELFVRQFRQTKLKCKMADDMKWSSASLRVGTHFLNSRLDACVLFGLSSSLNAGVCQCLVTTSYFVLFYRVPIVRVSKMASQTSHQIKPQTRSSKAKPQATASTSAASENNSALVEELPLTVCNNNNNTLARWPLSKYANFIISQRPGVGTWQEKTAGEPHDMWIQITQVRKLLIILHFLLFFVFFKWFIGIFSFVVAFSVDTFRFFTVMSYSSASTYRRSRECGRPSGI